LRLESTDCIENLANDIKNPHNSSVYVLQLTKVHNTYWVIFICVCKNRDILRNIHTNKAQTVNRTTGFLASHTLVDEYITRFAADIWKLQLIL